jgi:methyltransferase
VRLAVIILVTAIVLYGLMLIEAARAARNERAQLARGGVEPPGDVYRIMQVAYPAAFFVMLAEGWMRGADSSPRMAAGVMVFALAKALKWWAIVSLGESWTFRVIVVPGMPRVTSGPYRFIRHPNYLGVCGELVGAALITNATIAGPLATLAFMLLVARRAAVETRALDTLVTRD